jgi:lipoprotein-anchoring transpeptidase ErfK/SrfK
VTVAQSAPKADRLPSKALTKYRWSYAALALALLCMAAVAAFWPGNASPALALLRGPQPTQISGALAEVDKPTYTPTFTATFTPTATFTSTPTFTPTFTPTDTPLPTPTPVPTDTPWPTSIPFQPVAEEPLLYDYGYGVHWIDVDLSEQMVYAYEGDTIVASFLVSTGVAAYPTVVGQFHIYMKFEYTDMAGPGYYLPDVPYTMYFYKGYGLHGTYWHNNFGTPMSHGCVNMYTPDAQWLFYWAPMGTLVNVHY